MSGAGAGGGASDGAAVAIAWRPRAVPLVARAVVARGAAAGRLARRLLRLDDDALAALTAVAGGGALAVLGAADALPWVDGVVYLGRDDDAPLLLVPTALAPSVPVALLARALATRCTPAPIGVIAGDGAAAALVALGGARAIDRARLAAFAAEVV